MPGRDLKLAVIGGGEVGERHRRLAFETGLEIARRGAILLCGGRGGVMEGAAQGAVAGGGRTVGILPGEGPEESPPNAFIELAIYTGMGQARNQVLVLSADAVVGIAGSWGTLNEIAIAVKHGIPVALLESWRPEPPDGRDTDLLKVVSSPAEAVEHAIEAAQRRRGQ